MGTSESEKVKNASGHSGEEEQSERIRTMLKPFMLRREKEEVFTGSGFPVKKHCAIDCPLSLLQLGLMEKVGPSGGTKSSTDPSERSHSHPSLWMHQRKIVGHPYTVVDTQEQVPADAALENAMTRLCTDSGKFKVLSNILVKLVSAGHRVRVPLYYRSASMRNQTDSRAGYTDCHILSTDGELLQPFPQSSSETMYADRRAPNVDGDGHL